MAETSAVRLLLFRVGDLVCGADVDAVAEILPRVTATRIPGAMPFVDGLVNVRGTLVTVVTGWRALGRAAPTDESGGTIVLLRVEEGRRLVGLTVDEVVDLVTMSRGDLQDGATLPGTDPVLVRAVGRRADGPFVVLDTAALLSPVLTS